MEAASSSSIPREIVPSDRVEEPSQLALLDPTIEMHLRDYIRQGYNRVVDIGCGEGKWSSIAAETAVGVCSIDSDRSMIETAKKTAGEKKIVFIAMREVLLPYGDKVMNLALSVLLGNRLNTKELQTHVKGIKRVLEESGIALFAMPFSLDAVFTDGNEEIDPIEEIHEKLTGLDRDPLDEDIRACLEGMSHITGATFALDADRRLFLVKDTNSELEEGQMIWRKLSNGVVSNRFHSEEMYMDLFKEYDFEVLKEEKRCFTLDDLQRYNKGVEKADQLGEAYLVHPPFALYILKRCDG